MSMTTCKNSNISFFFSDFKAIRKEIVSSENAIKQVTGRIVMRPRSPIPSANKLVLACGTEDNQIVNAIRVNESANRLSLKISLISSTCHTSNSSPQFINCSRSPCIRQSFWRDFMDNCILQFNISKNTSFYICIILILTPYHNTHNQFFSISPRIFLKPFSFMRSSTT